MDEDKKLKRKEERRIIDALISELEKQSTNKAKESFVQRNDQTMLEARNRLISIKKGDRNFLPPSKKVVPNVKKATTAIANKPNDEVNEIGRLIDAIAAKLEKDKMPVTQQDRQEIADAVFRVTANMEARYGKTKKRRLSAKHVLAKARGERHSIENKIVQWKRIQSVREQQAERSFRWKHAADALCGRYQIGRAPFGGLIFEIVERAHRLVVIAEYHDLNLLASALASLNETATSTAQADPINALLRCWHSPKTVWKVKKPASREAVVLALIACWFAIESQAEAASLNIEAAAYLIARAIEAVTKAELSHDLVAANMGFHLLAERALQAGIQDGRTAMKAEQATAGGNAKGARTQLLKNYAHEQARLQAPPSGQWPSRRQAALKLLDGFKSHPEFVRLNMSVDQAYETLYGYLAEMPEASTLFTGKQGMSTRK